MKLLQNFHVLLTSDKAHNPLRRGPETTSVLRIREFFSFDFEMCSAPQRASTFSTSHCPRLFQYHHVSTLSTLKPAWRQKGAQFFNSHLATWFRTRRFREPTFRRLESQIIGKNTVFHDFLSCLRACIFFSLAFSSLIFFLLFSSLTSSLS